MSFDSAWAAVVFAGAGSGCETRSADDVLSHWRHGLVQPSVPVSGGGRLLAGSHQFTATLEGDRILVWFNDLRGTRLLFARSAPNWADSANVIPEILGLSDRPEVMDELVEVCGAVTNVLRGARAHARETE